MRDALLMVVVGVIAVMAAFSPRYGLWGYIWFSLFRPDILAFSPQRPYSMVLAVVTGVSALRAAPKAMGLLRNPLIWLFLAYQVWSGFSVLAALSVPLCFPQYTYFLTFSVICLAIPLLMETKVLGSFTSTRRRRPFSSIPWLTSPVVEIDNSDRLFMSS